MQQKKNLPVCLHGQVRRLWEPQEEAYFLAAFFAGAFFAGAFLAGAFFAAAFLAGAFLAQHLAAHFFAGAFFAGAFLGATFLVAISFSFFCVVIRGCTVRRHNYRSSGVRMIHNLAVNASVFFFGAKIFSRDRRFRKTKIHLHLNHQLSPRIVPSPF